MFRREEEFTHLMLIKSFQKSIIHYEVFKIGTLIFLIYLSNFSYLKAHYKGIFTTKEEAQLKANEIGCEGVFKIGDLWMPCKNEKELHKYLMTN